MLPSGAFAAGFVSQPIFLSTSPVTVGQNVRVYAIVSNDSPISFTGSVLISADGTLLGSPSSTMAIGATQTVSASWTPTTPGDHVIMAQLTANDGSVVQQVSQTFTITAPPPPVEPASASSTDANSYVGDSGYEPSTGIQDAIASISPALATDTQSVFAAIDTIRQAAAALLNTQISGADQALTVIHASASTSIATDTPNAFTNLQPLASTVPSLSTSQNSVKSIFWNIYLYILLALRFLIDNAAIFYPFLVLIFFYIIWRVYKRMSRPY